MIRNDSGAASFPLVALFDLDGTLVDSAPDMLATANRMRAAHGMEPMALPQLRPHVSKGSRAMLAAAFPHWEIEATIARVPEFLRIYQEELGRHSAAFAGIEELLQEMEQAGNRWGIVTNKPEYLARDVVRKLGWQSRCAVLIGGDSLSERKPHPLPLREAARRMDASIAECVYVGDDERDIQAARAAGMASIAVLWGYRLEQDPPTEWGAGRLAEQVGQLRDPAFWPRSA
ncbi:MAG: phosphoglycolate phosphatase [Xanthomonadaceae bacterium]|jgi:phosphoglycolate phosphatase|nr:phosphoglycolate phosphatase [Xanthomonadaceae bacterium]